MIAPSLRLAILALFASVAIALPARRTVAYIAPTSNGGSQFDQATNGLEPLNIIISALSSPSVLSTSGVEDWARSVGYSTECLGLHSGAPQTANLGDGRGWVNETAVIRADYGGVLVGTCLESLIGGNHFRFWQQNTTGAIFLATSHEEWVGAGHTIEPNGYDIGRDELVQAAVGTTQYNGVTYTTTAQNVTGLLPPGSAGIDDGISIDGVVVVLTIIASK